MSHPFKSIKWILIVLLISQLIAASTLENIGVDLNPWPATFSQQFIYGMGKTKGSGMFWYDYAHGRQRIQIKDPSVDCFT
jgi:hypothetical protein